MNLKLMVVALGAVVICGASLAAITPGASVNVTGSKIFTLKNQSPTVQQATFTMTSAGYQANSTCYYPFNGYSQTTAWTAPGTSNSVTINYNGSVPASTNYPALVYLAQFQTNSTSGTIFSYVTGQGLDMSATPINVNNHVTLTVNQTGYMVSYSNN